MNSGIRPSRPGKSRFPGASPDLPCTFTRDSCQAVDVEPGSYGAGVEDQSGQSDDDGFTIEQ